MTKIQSLSISESVLKFLFKYRVLLFLLLLFAVLRIPSLFEPHRYADEEIYLTLGQGVRNGLVLYRDIHDNKPPFLYFVAALAGDLFWFRLMLLFVHSLGVVIFWKFAEVVFGKKILAVSISTLVFGLFSTLPFFEGNIANSENFMIVPALLGALLLYKSVIDKRWGEKIWVYPIAGFLFSVGFLFKIPVAFDFVGLLLFWLVLTRPRLQFRNILARSFSKELWLTVIGFVLPILVSIVYYSLRGAFEPYVRSALLQNIGYLSSWGGSDGEGLVSNPLVWRGLVVFIVYGLITLISSKLELSTKFFAVWAVFSMYGALLSSRPYPHYLLEPLVPASFLATMIIFRKNLFNRLVVLGIILLLFFGYQQNSFWRYETVSYYNNYLTYASGGKSWEDYLRFWGANRNYKIADYISENSESGDRIYVWGTEPAIYAISKRLPVGRYTVSYHVVDFNAYLETINILKNTPPLYIVVFDSFDDFFDLQSFLNDKYFLEKEIDGVPIYKRSKLN